MKSAIPKIASSILPSLDPASSDPTKWQEILADMVTEPKELVKILGLDEDNCPPEMKLSKTATEQFSVKVPRPFLNQIKEGDWHDPLLKQVWPANSEEHQVVDFVIDPLQEQLSNPVPGLLHKYKGRVLLTVAPHCAIHCRYCFRRHFDYSANTPGLTAWKETLDYIRRDESIEEVIFSGGDPLAAPDRLLSQLVTQLDEIPHLTTLRIHTRLPLVIPQRINSKLLDWVATSRLRVVVVLHCNHAQEMSRSVTEAISKLSAIGCLMLNQSVLLKEVNDNLQALSALSKSLIGAGVLPYYLHLPDKVLGTAHFYVDAQTGQNLVEQMRQSLPGYLVPKLVREEPGKPSKTNFGPSIAQ